MNIDEEYSKAEQKLIRAVSERQFKRLSSVVGEIISPPMLYEDLAKEAFRENRTGPEIEALRRVVDAISKCNPYRRTPEFDKLCEFETHQENTA